jgi:hypothetical protein
VSSLSEFSTLLCLRNTTIIHLWNEFSNYPRLAIHCKHSIEKIFTIIDFLRDIALLSRQKWIIEILALPLNSFSPNWISKKNLAQKSSQCVSILSFCEEEMKILAISPTREFEEKKDQAKIKLLLSLRNILKWENLFRSLSGFWEREIAIRVCSIRSEISYRFLSRSF